MADTSNKLPALQFYVGDWRKDVGVQALNYHDRGVWFEMLMLMHESEDRGKLVLNGQPMPDSALARLLGLTVMELQQSLTDIIGYGVASRDPQTGVLFCRRMVRDQHIREVRTAAGHKGGNPNLKSKGNSLDNQNPNQTPTPSSSSSISSSDDKALVPPSAPPADGSPRVSAAKEKKASSDERHTAFKDAIFVYYAHMNNQDECPWNGAEARQLSDFLKANPKLDIEAFRKLLRHRVKSQVNHAERPCKWLSSANNYTSGPIDRFGKPLETGATNGPNSQYRSPASQRRDNSHSAFGAAAALRRDRPTGDVGTATPGELRESGSNTGAGRIIDGSVGGGRP